MQPTTRAAGFVLGAVLALGTPAFALTKPSPISTPSPVMTRAPAPTNTSAPVPPPAPQQTPHPAKIKTLKRGSISLSQMTYGLTHAPQELAALGRIKKIDFNNVRIVRVSPLQRARLHLRAQSDVQTLARGNIFALQDAMLAQITASNSPPTDLQNVLANISVTDALSTVLNRSTIHAGVPLADVLRSNRIAMSQVLGVYVTGKSFINAIVK